MADLLTPSCIYRYASLYPQLQWKIKNPMRTKGGKPLWGTKGG